MPVDIVSTEEVDVNETNLMAAAVFENPRQAELAYGLLQQAKFSAKTMSFLQRKGEVLAELEPDGDNTELIDPDVQPVAHNPVMGALGGGAIGGVAGWLVGLGLAVIPGVGPFLVAGAISAMLTSAAVGAVAGGLAGGLLLWGAPNDIAHHYANELAGSRCLLIIATHRVDRQDLAADLLTRAGGQDVRIFVKEGQ